MTKTKGNLVIRYSDGSQDRFALARDEDDSSAVLRVEELLTSNLLFLELQDRVMIIPVNNIKSVEVTPKPKRFPRTAIRNLEAIP
ncbi:MAG TPA: hypothetical protein VLR94_04520 [Acidobacteriota bacterium]|nr:hypothetical protein [Acidobacteriota bacterium]